MDGYQYDATQLNTEITQCRQLGITAQEKYDLQQTEERAEIFALAVVGAAIWNALDCNNYSWSSLRRMIGRAFATEANDHNRVITKFGPIAIIVDKCMENRGYQILSQSGYGGG